MEVRYNKDDIQIIPETDMDKVYLESVLGLFEAGDTAIAKRIPVMSIDHAWAYLSIEKKEAK